MYDPASYSSIVTDFGGPRDLPAGDDYGMSTGIFGNRIGSDAGDEVEQDRSEATLGLFGVHVRDLDHHPDPNLQFAAYTCCMRSQLLNTKSYHP